MNGSLAQAGEIRLLICRGRLAKQLDFRYSGAIPLVAAIRNAFRYVKFKVPENKVASASGDSVKILGK